MKLDEATQLSSEEAAERDQEAVYLLHGFAGRPLWMHRLARFLCRAEYSVRNWGYASSRKTVAYHAVALSAELERVAAEGRFRRVHFVTHSLGGIVVRQVICEHRPPNIGRVVMLAPPNSGSHMARACALLFGRFCPVLGEISSKADSYVNRLRAPHQVEIGVIAASRDWIVRRQNTHLQTQKDHIVVRGDHVRLPLLRASAEQVLHFLTTGAFRHAVASG